MAEDKANKALRKVIINLIPREKYGGPVMKEDILSIDISDKLEQGKYYCLYDIRSEIGDSTHAIDYVTFQDYSQFKNAVEDIFDATLVNAKQRKAASTLMNQAFYDCKKYDASI